MPSAEITRPKKNLHRSNSLHSELSSNSTQSKKVVSFNRDVAIKRIPRGERASVKLVAVVRPNATESTNHRLWINDELSSPSVPSEQLFKEAQSIIDNVDRIECSSNYEPDRIKPANKLSSLFSRTLPNAHRLGRSNSEIPGTRSNHRLSNIRGSGLRESDSVPRDFNEFEVRRSQPQQFFRIVNTGSEQWRPRNVSQPKAVLRRQPETSSGSETRSTPPKDSSSTSHPDSDLLIAKRYDSTFTNQRNTSHHPTFQYSRITDNIQKPIPLYNTEDTSIPPEIIYAHIVSDDANGSKKTLHRSFRYTSQQGHGESNRESARDYSTYDQPAEYESDYRSPIPKNNITTVLLNRIDENDSYMNPAPPRPFFYGDSIDGRHFNSSSLDSSSSEPSPTPTKTGYQAETERRNYTREPSRLDYRILDQDYKITPKEFNSDNLRKSKDDFSGSGKGFLNHSPTSMNNGFNQTYCAATKEKDRNERNTSVVPETKHSNGGGGLISTLMRRNKAKKGSNSKSMPEAAGHTAAVVSAPKAVKKSNKFFSLFTIEKKAVKNRNDRWSTNTINEANTKEMSTVGSLDKDYVRDQSVEQRDIGNYHESPRRAWKPSENRHDTDTATISALQIHDSFTMQRPTKQISDYTSRSKSLDRRTLRKDDSHQVDAWFKSPKIENTVHEIERDGRNSPSVSNPFSRNNHGFDPNFRYFGDTDIENYTTMRSRHDTHCRNGFPTPTQNMTTKKLPQHGKSATSLMISESVGSETGGVGSSSGSSQRSVYLHAPAVAEIPPLNFRRAISRDEIFSLKSNETGAGVGGKRSSRLARSVSVLAPWRPRIYRVE